MELNSCLSFSPPPIIAEGLPSCQLVEFTFFSQTHPESMMSSPARLFPQVVLKTQSALLTSQPLSVTLTSWDVFPDIPFSSNFSVPVSVGLALDRQRKSLLVHSNKCSRHFLPFFPASLILCQLPPWQLSWFTLFWLRNRFSGNLSLVSDFWKPKQRCSYGIVGNKHVPPFSLFICQKQTIDLICFCDSS